MFVCEGEKAMLRRQNRRGLAITPSKQDLAIKVNQKLHPFRWMLIRKRPYALVNVSKNNHIIFQAHFQLFIHYLWGMNFFFHSFFQLIKLLFLKNKESIVLWKYLNTFKILTMLCRHRTTFDSFPCRQLHVFLVMNMAVPTGKKKKRLQFIFKTYFIQ